MYKMNIFKVFDIKLFFIAATKKLYYYYFILFVNYY